MDRDGLMDCQRAQSQQEGKEDEGTLKELGGVPLAVLPLPGPPGIPSGSGLPGNPSSYILLHQAILMLKRAVRAF